MERRVNKGRMKYFSLYAILPKRGPPDRDCMVSLTSTCPQKPQFSLLPPAHNHPSPAASPNAQPFRR